MAALAVHRKTDAPAAANRHAQIAERRDTLRDEHVHEPVRETRPTKVMHARRGALSTSESARDETDCPVEPIAALLI